MDKRLLILLLLIAMPCASALKIGVSPAELEFTHAPLSRVVDKQLIIFNPNDFEIIAYLNSSALIHQDSVVIAPDSYSRVMIRSEIDAESVSQDSVLRITASSGGSIDYAQSLEIPVHIVVEKSRSLLIVLLVSLAVLFFTVGWFRLRKRLC